jgi:hypothetical protein
MALSEGGVSPDSSVRFDVNVFSQMLQCCLGDSIISNQITKSVGKDIYPQ